MHLPDGFIDPRLSAGLGFAAVGAVFFALNKVKQVVLEPAAQTALAGIGEKVSSISGKAKQTLSRFGQQYIIKMGLVASLVFAFQLFDFPVFPQATGHLLGGALAAIILGPWGGFLTLTGAVIIQAVFLADGGIIALGANIINIAFVTTFTGYYIYSYLKSKIRPSLAIGIATWCSVFLAATSYSLVSGIQTMPEMLSVHAIVGLAEALITIALVRLASLFTPLDKKFPM